MTSNPCSGGQSLIGAGQRKWEVKVESVRIISRIKIRTPNTYWALLCAGTILSTLHVNHLNLTIMFEAGINCYCPHFTDEKTKVSRGE